MASTCGPGHSGQSCRGAVVDDRAPGTDVSLTAIRNLPEIRPGADLSRILIEAFDFAGNDILVLAQKIVSKAEGRLVQLDSVAVTKEARQLAHKSEKDPRIAQLVMDESNAILRVRAGLLIVEDQRGWVCANAGIDRSNISQENGRETVCLLPLDPDYSAAQIGEGIRRFAGVDVGVIISDSHGRAWREGMVGVAIGASGLEVLSDLRGRPDRQGYILQHTLVGVCDELASAASLLMGQAAEGLPAVVIRGLNLSGEGTARSLQRPQERDLFR